MTQDENIKAVFALLDQAYKSNNSTAIQVAETKYTQMAAKEGCN